MNEQVTYGGWLHTDYELDLYPSRETFMRRDRYRPDVTYLWPEDGGGGLHRFHGKKVRITVEVVEE